MTSTPEAAYPTRAVLDQQIAYYRAHPARVAEIARAGQERTLREHMMSHRLRAVVELVGGRRRASPAAA